MKEDIILVFNVTKNMENDFMNYLNKILKNSIFKLAGLSVTINLIVEILSRRSLIGGFKFIIKSPGYFLVSGIIIFITLLICMLFKRRAFLASLISCIWLGAGIINCIVLGFREKPFAGSDILMVKSTIGIIDKYFNNMQICLIVVAIVAVISILAYMWFKLPQSQVISNKLIYSICMLVLIGIVIISFNRETEAKNISSSFSNLSSAYDDYGFVYCFSNSVVNIGIDRPFDYSEETVEKILNEMSGNGNETTQSIETPNIIYVQLESFMDLQYVDNMKVYDDYLTNFRHLKENYTSGKLTVPVVGGGTANTEFEVLSSMNIGFFGAGEYPYKTILKDSTCDSIAYNMKEQGYATHAIHNNDGTFYDRDKVYANLGFDVFTPIEYMYNVEYNSKGWAKDDILIENIREAIENTETPDLVFVVSVQGHGKYPSEIIESEDNVTSNNNVNLETDSDNVEEINRLDYYINETNQMDGFIGNLISSIEEIGEPTVIVFYGDHQPNLDFTEENLIGITRYNTEYVIWDNIGLNKEDEDIYSYQLASKVYDCTGIMENTMAMYHNVYKDNKQYQENMKVLQYDMLYGKLYSCDNNELYQSTNMRFGEGNIIISNIVIDGYGSYIYGEGFNEFSRVLVNGKEKDSVYIDYNTIKYNGNELGLEDEISIVQVGEDGKQLGSSQSYIIK